MKLDIIRGVRPAAARVVIYGVAGIGKSTEQKASV